jgi:glycosyltransferase involved in cell wall biosynthesis
MSQTHTPTGDKRVAPTVSVIIPAYNVAPFIAEALDSVLAQTFKDYEIIVVNDGSPDTEELERVLEPYLPRIVYLKQENRGLSGARNTGIRAARAPFIALLDADDIWKPDYLAVQLGVFEGDPTIDVLYPNALNFGEGPYAGREYMRDCPSEGEVTFESLVAERCQPMVSVTGRREVFVRAGLFDESLRSVEDLDMWLRIVKAGGRMAYHRRALVLRRCWGGSLSADPVWMYKHNVLVLEKAGRTLDVTTAEREALREKIAYYRALLTLYEGKKAFMRGDAKTTIDKLAEANLYFKSRRLALIARLVRFAPNLLLNAYIWRDRFIFRTNTRF